MKESKSCCSVNTSDKFNLIKPQSRYKKYEPLFSIFGVTAMIALAFCYSTFDSIPLLNLFASFVGLSMCFLGILKLQNLTKFKETFQEYDLIAMKCNMYGWIYPYIEITAGVLMIAGLAKIPVALTMLFISSVGIFSIVKAVYIEKRALKCSCVGGDKDVPLGAISIIENLIMLILSVITLLV